MAETGGDPRVPVVSICATCEGSGKHPDPTQGSERDIDGNFSMVWFRDSCPAGCSRGKVTEYVPAAEFAKRFGGTRG